MANDKKAGAAYSMAIAPTLHLPQDSSQPCLADLREEAKQKAVLYFRQLTGKLERHIVSKDDSFQLTQVLAIYNAISQKPEKNFQTQQKFNRKIPALRDPNNHFAQQIRARVENKKPSFLSLKELLTAAHLLEGLDDLAGILAKKVMSDRKKASIWRFWTTLPKNYIAQAPHIANHFSTAIKAGKLHYAKAMMRELTMPAIHVPKMENIDDFFKLLRTVKKWCSNKKHKNNPLQFSTVYQDWKNYFQVDGYDFGSISLKPSWFKGRNTRRALFFHLKRAQSFLKRKKQVLTIVKENPTAGKKVLLEMNQCLNQYQAWVTAESKKLSAFWQGKTLKLMTQFSSELCQEKRLLKKRCLALVLLDKSYMKDDRGFVKFKESYASMFSPEELVSIQMAFNLVSSADSIENKQSAMLSCANLRAMLGKNYEGFVNDFFRVNHQEKSSEAVNTLITRGVACLSDMLLKKSGSIDQLIDILTDQKLAGPIGKTNQALRNRLIAAGKAVQAMKLTPLEKECSLCDLIASAITKDYTRGNSKSAAYAQEEASLKRLNQVFSKLLLPFDKIMKNYPEKTYQLSQWQLDFVDNLAKKLNAQVGYTPLVKTAFFKALKKDYPILQQAEKNFFAQAKQYQARSQQLIEQKNTDVLIFGKAMDVLNSWLAGYGSEKYIGKTQAIANNLTSIKSQGIHWHTMQKAIDELGTIYDELEPYQQLFLDSCKKSMQLHQSRLPLQQSTQKQALKGSGLFASKQREAGNFKQHNANTQVLPKMKQ